MNVIKYLTQFFLKWLIKKQQGQTLLNEKLKQKNKKSDTKINKQKYWTTTVSVQIYDVEL